MQYENLLTNLVTADHQSYLLSCCSLPVLASLLDLEWKIISLHNPPAEQNRTTHHIPHYITKNQSSPNQPNGPIYLPLFFLGLISSSVV